MYGGKKDTFLTFHGSSDGVNFKNFVQVFHNKNYVFLCYFILKTVHIFVFVQKNRLGLKYSFLSVPSTSCLTVSCPVTTVVNSGILEQRDGNMSVVVLKQCCILSGNVPMDFFANQKDEFISDL